MIEVKNLTKYFGSRKVVSDISFNVKKGEILGFLGPNGAGKSTTMRIITGFIPPSDGTALIGGADITGDSINARKKIGYLPENAPVYPDMTVFGYLDFCAEIRGFSGPERKKRVEETIEKCFLTDVRFQSIGTLSKGFKQRVCFAQSIIHDPEYLILDEPTDGLDPNQKHEVRRMIRRMSAEKAIILSTHILDEADAICNRVIIIAEGCIIADGTPDTLRARSSVHGAITLSISNADPEKFISRMENMNEADSVKLIERNDNTFKARIFPKNADPGTTDRLISAVFADRDMIKSIFVEQGRLDEVFRNITTAK